MSTRLELTIERDGDRTRLLSPEVGLFTQPRTTGEVLAPGESAGMILALGRTFELVVPADVSGVVVSNAPDRARHPVGYADVLYELAPSAGELARAPHARETSTASSRGLVLRAQQSGRFYHRPAPTEPPFTAVGAILHDGVPVGMIEVMKTFSHVIYRSGGALPARAHVARIVAADGADVKSGDVLLELEGAGE